MLPVMESPHPQERAGGELAACWFLLAVAESQGSRVLAPPARTSSLPQPGQGHFALGIWPEGLSPAGS